MKNSTQSPNTDQPNLLVEDVVLDFNSAPIAEIEVALIDYPPGEKPSDANVTMLAKLISAQGLQNPIVVLTRGARFEVVEGRRRLAAVRSLGRTSISAKVIDKAERNALTASVIALTGNYARSSNDVSDFYAVKRLHEEKGYTPRQINEATGMPQQRVTQLLKLASLDPDLFKAFAVGKIKRQSAYELALMSQSQQQRALKKLTDNGKLTVDDVRGVRKIDVKAALAAAPDDMFGSDGDDSDAWDLLLQMFESRAAAKGAAKDPLMIRVKQALIAAGKIAEPDAE